MDRRARVGVIFTIEMKQEPGIRQPKNPREPFEMIESAMILYRYEGIHKPDHWREIFMQIWPQEN